MTTTTRRAATALGPPTDQDARDLIGRDALDATLFVEAGAGTGKTTQLVTRIVNLVLGRDVPLADIAAITFTEAAARELQARIRVAFERRLADPQTPPAERERCARAVADADLAAISTLHGFAARILTEFSTAAGLPPRVTVLDEVSSQLAHERRWDLFVERLHGRAEHEELLYRAVLIGVPLTPAHRGQASFKEVAANFAQNWDRLDALVDDDAAAAPLGAIDFSSYDAAVDALGDAVSICTDPEDRLVRHISDVLLPAMRAVAAMSDPHRKLRHLGRRRSWPKGGNIGRKAAWWCPPADIRALIDDVNDAVGAVVRSVGEEVVTQLMRLTAAEVRAAARARQADGGLEFHDLLVLARRVLRDKAEVRRALHDRYRCLLLDEFQDTDPIQIELASLIAAVPAAHQPARWEEHTIEDGRLFFVGDPKQSIYRFRRADIGLFLAARRAFGRGDPVRLRTNFRTVAPILDWVNGVFAAAMPVEIEGRQPGYEALAAHRAPSPDGDHRPIVLGGEHPDPKVRAATLREVEAADVAAVIADIAAAPERWPVFDERHAEWRPASLADVAVLIPTRTSLPFLRDALDRSGTPYRLATGTLVYDTQEVRDALAVLRAVDDPNDTLSLVAALRSPLYGCSDVDLFTYHRHRRTWDLRAGAPDGIDADHPVVLALAHLRELWAERWWAGPAALLDRVLRDRRAFLLGYGDARPTEVWRRLRFLLDQARAFEAAHGVDLRAFVEWAALQSADGARVHEPLLPETDDDAVQILTVHGAKGLEFPITVLSGLTTQNNAGRNGISVLWGVDGPPEVRLRADVSTAEHEPRADLEVEMDAHEKLRLLYVAATRARDHLVVSGHHKASKDAGATFATRLAAYRDTDPTSTRPFEPAQPERGRARSDAGGRGATGVPQPAVETADGPLDTATVFAQRDDWIRDRRSLLAASARRAAMSATAIARTVDATLVDVDDDSAGGGGPDGTAGPAAGSDDGDGRWRRPLLRRRGRAGSAIGRAVHGTLEVVDLADPVDVEALVRRQCDVESIPDAVDTVVALVRSALSSDAIALARRHRFHREMYVAAPLGAVTIEGYVDLLVVTPDGLVIVDYKTDATSSPAAIDAKVAAYELQAAAYALALESSTGLPVLDCRFVFCGTGDAVERGLPDLADAMRRVRDVVLGSGVLPHPPA